ncbi:hypothetical protein ABKN59_003055 [Abortiporus biennis]
MGVAKYETLWTTAIRVPVLHFGKFVCAGQLSKGIIPRFGGETSSAFDSGGLSSTDTLNQRSSGSETCVVTSDITGVTRVLGHCADHGGVAACTYSGRALLLSGLWGSSQCLVRCPFTTEFRESRKMCSLVVLKPFLSSSIQVPVA